MTDLVERLRAKYKTIPDLPGAIPVTRAALWINPDGPEAAAEIERLEAENAAVKADNAWLQGMYDHLIDRRPHAPGGSYTSSLKPGVLKELWDKLKAKEAENKALLEEIEKYRHGYQGSCYACEPVGMLNQALQEKIDLMEKGND